MPGIWESRDYFPTRGPVPHAPRQAGTSGVPHAQGLELESGIWESRITVLPTDRHSRSPACNSYLHNPPRVAIPGGTSQLPVQSERRFQ